MRRRIYCLLPDLESARATMDDLLQARIELHHLHFVAREDCDLSGLQAASVLETSDVIRSAEAGLLTGAAVGGLLGAFAAVSYPGPGELPQWNLFPALVFAGAIIDAWTSSMIGISAPNKRLQPFTAAIEQGRILLMVDVPIGRVEEIGERLRRLQPRARMHGGEPEMPSLL